MKPAIHRTAGPPGCHRPAATGPATPKPATPAPASPRATRSKTTEPCINHLPMSGVLRLGRISCRQPPRRRTASSPVGALDGQRIKYAGGAAAYGNRIEFDLFEIGEAILEQAGQFQPDLNDRLGSLGIAGQQAGPNT